MLNKRVLIIYERKNRELENSILLKVALENRGFLCEIAQFYEGRKFNILDKNRYDLFFVPHLYNTREVLRVIARFGVPKNIINLQYEQVLSEKWEKLGHHNPSGEAKYFDHICWGVTTANRLFSTGVPQENIHTIGALQLDLLRDEYKEGVSAKSQLAKEFLIPESSPWCLFLSSFTYADIDASRLLMNEKVAGTKLDSFVEIHSKSRKALLSWFDNVLSQDCSKVFIYRPHPDELELDDVKVLETKHPNFFIVSDGAAKVWIEGSDQIFSWYSTTVVESHFLKKSYSILRPYDLPDSFDSVLLKKGKFVTDEKEFQRIYSLGNGKSEFALNADDVNDYYAFGDEPAFKQLINLIASLPENKRIKSYSFSRLLPSRLKSFLAYIMYSLTCIASKHSNVGRMLNVIPYFSDWNKEIITQAYSNEEEIKLIKSINLRLFK